jgi:hypothetical protein
MKTATNLPSDYFIKSPHCLAKHSKHLTGNVLLFIKKE